MNWQIVRKSGNRWHPFTELRFHSEENAIAFCRLIIADRKDHGAGPPGEFGYREHNPQVYSKPYGKVKPVEME